jgi:hypothetical protein
VTAMIFKQVGAPLDSMHLSPPLRYPGRKSWLHGAVRTAPSECQGGAAKS